MASKLTIGVSQTSNCFANLQQTTLQLSHECNDGNHDVKVYNKVSQEGIAPVISLTAEYALRAVVFLAGSELPRVSRTDIADATLVPHDYLTKVLQELDRAGIVQAQRGPGGGYSLVSSAEKTTVYDVIIAVSSLPRIDACPLGIEDHIRLCPLHKALDEATETVEKAFRRTSISDLVPKKSKRSQCKFPASK